MSWGECGDRWCARRFMVTALHERRPAETASPLDATPRQAQNPHAGLRIPYPLLPACPEGWGECSSWTTTR